MGPAAAKKTPHSGVDRWTLSSHDIDEQAGLLPSWRQSYVQLECGRLTSVVDGVSLPGGMGLFRKCTDRKLHKTFSTPDDTYAVALLTADSDRIGFQGVDARAGDALLLPPGHVFDIISHGRFDVWVATLPGVHLTSGDSASTRLEPGVWRSGDEVGGPRALMEAIVAALHIPVGAAATREQLLQPMLIDLDERVIQRFGTGRAGELDGSACSRLASETLAKARRILLEEASGTGEVPRVSELAARLGVSVRLLHQVFRQRMGVPPRLYAERVRLSRARTDLRAARSGEVTVAEIAVKWGFWHLGRFASTYQATFGELPSQSLRH